MSISCFSSSGNGAANTLLPSKPRYTGCKSDAGDELRSFRSCLRLMCMDQSSTFRALVSWSLFLLLAVAVPAVSHFVLSYSPHRRPYDSAVQLSLTLASALAFLRLSAMVNRYGLRKVLFLDKVAGESDRVRLGYTEELSRSFRILACFLAPCTAAEAAYKLCSIGLVTGLLICLRSAAKITHKAQTLTSHAAMWHVSATIDFYEPEPEPETPFAVPCDRHVIPVLFTSDESDEENTGAEDELEDTKILQPQANTISFQKRQALVTYLENNKAGITVFGFVLDRTCLHTIFTLQLSLVLWLLGRTIGIS